MPNEETIESITVMDTRLMIAVPNDDTDNRAFMVCRDCHTAFELLNSEDFSNPVSQLVHPFNVYSRIMQAIRHITACKSEEFSDDGSSRSR